MGIFDSVYVDCPHCGAKVEHQSKADDPYMKTYQGVESAPLVVAIDILNEPQYCRQCEKWHAITHPDYPIEAEAPNHLIGAKVRPIRTPADREISIHSTQPFLRWWYTDVTPFSDADFTDDSSPNAKSPRD